LLILSLILGGLNGDTNNLAFSGRDKMTGARCRKIFCIWVLGTITAATVSVFGPLAFAAPPDNADSALSRWFESLRQPGTGMPCCSIADCRVTDSRSLSNSYQALIENRWRDIPSDRVLDYMPNPTGRAVVCYSPLNGILCFVRPPDT